MLVRYGDFFLVCYRRTSQVCEADTALQTLTWGQRVVGGGKQLLMREGDSFLTCYLRTVQALEVDTALPALSLGLRRGGGGWVGVTCS